MVAMGAAMAVAMAVVTVVATVVERDFVCVCNVSFGRRSGVGSLFIFMLFSCCDSFLQQSLRTCLRTSLRLSLQASRGTSLFS
jgi:ABC-type uncharacterized transport system permease subunit